jgi:hypothetical protein
MRIKGKIATWNDEKGFWFIAPNAGGKQIFIHIKFSVVSRLVFQYHLSIKFLLHEYLIRVAE